jgi:CRISPR-associated protein Cst2
MRNNVKGIELVWLSKTDLTNMNSGEGGTNFVDVKKYKKGNIEYPYVSGQAMRHYLRSATRRNLAENEIMCFPNDEGEGCGNPSECLNCDLFGFMKTIKGQGANVRVSPVKVSPAMGLLPMDENSTIDFLTRKKLKQTDEKAGGDIVNVELGVNIYKCGISIDIARVGKEEEVNSENGKLEIKKLIKDENVINNRIDKVMDSVMFITDYSKQSRLLTDFTPDVLIGASQTRYSHRLQKALEIDENSNLNIDKFKAIVSEVQSYSDVFFGIIPGLLNNGSDLETALNELKIEKLTPAKVIEKLKINES